MLSLLELPASKELTNVPSTFVAQNGEHLRTVERENDKIEFIWNETTKRVEFRTLTPESTHIYQERISPSGFRYGVFYSFNHPQNEDDTSTLTVSIQRKGTNEFIKPELAHGGATFKDESNQLTSITSGLEFESPEKTSSGITVHCPGHLSPSNIVVEKIGEDSKYHPRSLDFLNPHNRFIIHSQNPDSLMVKKISIPREIDFMFIQKLTEARTDIDHSTKSFDAPWREIALHLPVDFDMYLLNYLISDSPKLDTIGKTDALLRHTPARRALTEVPLGTTREKFYTIYTDSLSDQ